ncbi:hypothetical protein Tco_0469512 [Tanacetum coccineum]
MCLKKLIEDEEVSLVDGVLEGALGALGFGDEGSSVLGNTSQKVKEGIRTTQEKALVRSIRAKYVLGDLQNEAEISRYIASLTYTMGYNHQWRQAKTVSCILVSNTLIDILLSFHDAEDAQKLLWSALKARFEGVSTSSSQNIAFLSTEIKGSTLKQSTADRKYQKDILGCLKQGIYCYTHDDEDCCKWMRMLLEEIGIDGMVLGHFARECRFAKYQENRANGRKEKKIVAIEDSIKAWDLGKGELAQRGVNMFCMVTVLIHLIKDCDYRKNLQTTKPIKPKGNAGFKDTKTSLIETSSNRVETIVTSKETLGTARPRVPQAVLSQSTGRPYYPRMDK